MIPPPAQRQMAARPGATVAEAGGSHRSIFQSLRPWRRSLRQGGAKRELQSGGLTQAKWAAGFHVGGRRRNLLGRVPLNRTGESHGRPRGLCGVDNAGKGGYATQPGVGRCCFAYKSRRYRSRRPYTVGRSRSRNSWRLRHFRYIAHTRDNFALPLACRTLPRRKCQIRTAIPS